MANVEGARWFLGEVWPQLRLALPRAKLHLYGGDVGVAAQDVICHDRPWNRQKPFRWAPSQSCPCGWLRESVCVFSKRGQRGLPVVATTQAASGLDIVSGKELLLADTAADFVEAACRVAGNPAMSASLVAGGRAY